VLRRMGLVDMRRRRVSHETRNRASQNRRHAHRTPSGALQDELVVAVEDPEDKVHRPVNVPEGPALAELSGLRVVVGDLVADAPTPTWTAVGFMPSCAQTELERRSTPLPTLSSRRPGSVPGRRPRWSERDMPGMGRRDIRQRAHVRAQAWPDGYIAVRHGDMARAQVGGLQVGTEHSQIRPPSELHIPFMHPSIKRGVCGGTVGELSKGTDDARRLGGGRLARHRMRNTVSIKEDTGIIVLRAGFEVLFGAGDMTSAIRDASAACSTGGWNRAQAPSRYAASTCTSAVDRFRPLRPVRAGAPGGTGRKRRRAAPFGSARSRKLGGVWSARSRFQRSRSQTRSCTSDLSC
jgi:hypothetical protein